jgi:hypothetical protein
MLCMQFVGVVGASTPFSSFPILLESQVVALRCIKFS